MSNFKRPTTILESFQEAFRNNGTTINKGDLNDPQVTAAMSEFRDLRNRIDALGGKLESLGITGAQGLIAGRTGKVENDGPNSSKSNDAPKGTAARFILEMRAISPKG